MDDSGRVDDRAAFAFGLMTGMGTRGLGGTVRMKFRVDKDISQVSVAFVGDQWGHGEGFFQNRVILENVKVADQSVLDGDVVWMVSEGDDGTIRGFR